LTHDIINGVLANRLKIAGTNCWKPVLKGGDPVPGADGWSEAKAAAKAALKAGKTAAEAARDGAYVGLRALAAAGQYTYGALCTTFAPEITGAGLVGGLAVGVPASVKLQALGMGAAAADA
jgi:hypothetical protein